MSTMDTIDVVVRDGSTVCLRHAEPIDADAIAIFLQALSPMSRYFRFLGFRKFVFYLFSCNLA
jgi:hypothetical protein